MKPTLIAGCGAVTCYGRGTARLAQGLASGQQVQSPVKRFEFTGSENVIANEVDREGLSPGRQGEIELMMLAMDEALADAGLQNASLHNCALIVGASSFLYAGEAEYRYQYSMGSGKALRTSGFSGMITEPVVERYGIGGPVFAVHTACSSSANAMILAHEMLVYGEVDYAIVVGAEGLSGIGLGGFNSLMLLDPEGCRPFDSARQGLQIGEAFSAVVLTTADNTNPSPGKKALLLGGYNLCDTHHVTSASPDGSSMVDVIEHTLQRAELSVSDIDFIKAHGTGSRDNDTAEGTALKRVFGNTVPPFTVLKRYLGHTLGACGVVETVAMIACLRAGIVPATAGFRDEDPELNISPLVNSLDLDKATFLSNFFGFGGNYAALVVRYG